MFVVLVEFRLNEGSEAPFLEAVLRQARDSLEKEEHCRQFDVCVDAEDPSTIILYELYDTRGDFDDHLDSDHFQNFDTHTKAMVATKAVRLLTQAES